MKIVKQNWLTAILLIVIVILVISKFTTKPEIIDNTQLIKQIDSLTNVVVKQKDAADKAEKEFLNKTDSIEFEHEAKLYALRKTYSNKSNTIRNFTIDEQIGYFKKQVFEDGIYPVAEIMNSDSIVKITADQFVETNQKFNELNYLYELKDTIENELDKAYNLINESKKVIGLKNDQIKSQEMIAANQYALVKNLNYALEEERKAKKRGIVKGSIIGGLVGVGIGIFIMK